MDVLENDEVNQYLCPKSQVFIISVLKLLTNHNKTAQELKELFRSIDTDGSESLSLSEVILFLKVFSIFIE